MCCSNLFKREKHLPGTCWDVKIYFPDSLREIILFNLSNLSNPAMAFTQQGDSVAFKATMRNRHTNNTWGCLQQWRASNWEKAEESNTRDHTKSGALSLHPEHKSLHKLSGFQHGWTEGLFKNACTSLEKESTLLCTVNQRGTPSLKNKPKKSNFGTLAELNRKWASFQHIKCTVISVSSSNTSPTEGCGGHTLQR